MTNTSVIYNSGDETEELFWRSAAAKGLTCFEICHRRTEWVISEILGAVDTGITVHAILSRSWKDRITALVAELSADSRGTAMLMLKSQSSTKMIFGSIIAGSPADMAFYRDAILTVPQVPEPEPEEENGIFIDFTYHGQHGPVVTTREIAAPQWEEIRGNYTAALTGKLDEMIAGTPGERTGKVAVLHGPPGTGKTYFLRALARAWAKQARFFYIIDAEAFFGDAGYMMRVLLKNNDFFDDGDDDGRWYVIICEDAEEFVAHDAKASTGQALSRLLNLGDGMLGQGLKVLFLFTTNVKMNRLHPAIIRDGRCFLNAEFPPFSATEAGQWLRSHGCNVTPSGEKTLTELYVILRDGEPAAAPGYNPSQAYL